MACLATFKNAAIVNCLHVYMHCLLSVCDSYFVVLFVFVWIYVRERGGSQVDGGAKCRID